MFRKLSFVRAWKPTHNQLETDSFNSSFVEAVIEKSFFSKQDYIGIAENLVYHGRNETEFKFGQALMNWNQQGQRLIESIQTQDNIMSQQGNTQYLQEQEQLYKNELLNKIYLQIEEESRKGEFFQYSIYELNRETKQFEVTRIGVSKGLSSLLGTDETILQSIILRNGTIDYLGNGTSLRILQKQLYQKLKSSEDMLNKQLPHQQQLNSSFYSIIQEDEAIMHTLDDFRLPCKILQYNLPIVHNLFEKYHDVAFMWSQLKNTTDGLQMPDLAYVEMRFVDVEAYAIESLLQLRYKQFNSQTNAIETLTDEIEYSIRSIYFIEKFYVDKLEKKKRYRRKKGHINDWEYLQHKYEEYKLQNNEIK